MGMNADSSFSYRKYNKALNYYYSKDSLIPEPPFDFAEDQLWAKKIIELGYSKAYTSNAVVYHSHNYSFKEMLMRSFDDHKGLNQIYDYIPVKNILYFWRVKKQKSTSIYFLDLRQSVKIC